MRWTISDTWQGAIDKLKENHPQRDWLPEEELEDLILTEFHFEDGEYSIIDLDEDLED